MSMTISGDGTITGLVAGGLPDATVTAPDLNGAQSGTAPVFGARAWCMFNGVTTGTNAPTGGGNVTSVTRDGTGTYTINFTTAMPSTAYAFVVTVRATGSNYLFCSPTLAATKTTSALQIHVVQSTAGTPTDSSEVTVLVFA